MTLTQRAISTIGIIATIARIACGLRSIAAISSPISRNKSAFNVSSTISQNVLQMVAGRLAHRPLHAVISDQDAGNDDRDRA